MTLVKFNPWNAIERAENEMRQFFDDFRGGFSLSTSFDHSAYIPQVDTSEDDKNIYVTAELPGLTKEDVNVTLTENVLSIQGKKQRKTESTERNYHRSERSFGEFTRKIALPAGIFLQDKIQANFDSGVLEIVVPKDETRAPKTKSRVIPIISGSNGRAQLKN